MNSAGGGAGEPRSREVYRSAIGVPLVAALMVISFTLGLRQSLAGEQSDLSGVLLIGGALAALSLAAATGVAVGLSNLINDFIDLQRMESKGKACEHRPIRLPPLIGETLAFFQGGGTHFLRLDLPSELPPVSGDVDGIRQAVSNPISNAMKFSPDGGRIEVGARREGSEALLWVKDQGIGIAPADVPRLFSKFFRVRTVKTQGVGGSGLGLALVKQIVTAMNGRV